MTTRTARVLVVEDDPAVMRAVRVALTNQGHEVLAAATGAEAVTMAAGGHPRLMVLDLGLPDIDGIEVIRRVRPEQPTLPIIVLSAYGDDRTKITALDLGADDYVTKPFGIPELLARVRAGLRRVAQTDGGNDATFPHHSRVRIDAAAQRVWAGDRVAHLTPTQFRVLCVLAANPGRVLPHATIVRRAWDEAVPGAVANLRVVVGQLRRAIEVDPHRPSVIVTLPGVGYRFDDPEHA